MKLTNLITTLTIALTTAFAASTLASATETKSVPTLTNKEEVAAFVDQEMTQAMAKFHIPGAVISIVKDDQLLFSNGYGQANTETKQEIKADSSMFRIASTTKLFTWTAVMQLVEKGEIDLDTDINTYLTAFQIPETFKEPITMRHLMTHNAGFE